MEALNPILRELIGTASSKLLDPSPIGFKPADDAGIGPVRIGSAKPAGTLHTFRKQLNRNAFLRGCAVLTVDAPVEHLIAGFGFRHGSTTVVEHMSHTVGSASSVSIPNHIASAIRDHMHREHVNEVLLFHNHPRNAINVVLDNTPLPSSTDRAALVGFHSDIITLGKAIVGGGRVRFYLGENGFVQEFCAPELLTLFARATGAFPQARGRPGKPAGNGL